MEGLRIETDGLRIETDGLRIETDGLRIETDGLRIDDLRRLNGEARLLINPRFPIQTPPLTRE